MVIPMVRSYVVPNGLLTGLVAYYKCLDANDSVGSANLTNNGGATFGAGTLAGEGAAVFDGTNSLNYPLSSTFALLHEDWLISQWIKPDAGQGFMYSSSLYDADTNGCDIECATDPGFGPFIGTELYDGSGHTAFIDVDFQAAGAWTNVLFWHTTADKTIHQLVNGLPVGTNTATYAAMDEIAQTILVVGSSVVGAGAPYFGSIGSMGWWRGTIPGADGRALLAAGIPLASYTA